MKKQVSTYPLRLPTSLKAAVAEISKADGTSINQFVTTAVAENVCAMKSAEFFTERASQADIATARRLLRRDRASRRGTMTTCHDLALEYVQGRPQDRLGVRSTRREDR